MQLLGGDKNVSSSKELINSLQTLKIKSGASNDLHGSGSNQYGVIISAFGRPVLFE